MDAPSGTSSAATASRLDVITEKAARRGRIKHPEGDRYETLGWNDVEYLLGMIEGFRAELQRCRKTARGAGRYV